jgi:GTP-binding protein
VISQNASFTRTEIEAGRKIFSGEWTFSAAANAPTALPPMRGVEIAFAGRSNVGKSSLINALTGRRSLARTSKTPGRTQDLIFFSGPGQLTLVDMPGYGHASASKEKIAAWTGLIEDFLRGRANLARVYVLVDARHGLKEIDTHVLKVLSAAAVSHQIVLTKAEAVKPSELPARIKDTGTALTKFAATFPSVIATSAHNGMGIAELRAAIGRLLVERG